MEQVTCFVTQKQFDRNECIQGNFLRENMYEFIQEQYPGFSRDSYISNAALNDLRHRYLEYLITEETGELGKVEQEVVESIAHNKILSENIEPDIDEKLTFGQRLADTIAEFGGSWTFIMVFFFFLMLWILLNIWWLASRAFDPFPFILLNLILSCIAAIQAPVIMMSQNRQEQKDRIRGEHDYKINLKAELEIKLLHEKIDHLIIHQNKKLMEIQEIQAEYLDDILKNMGGRGNKNG
jgi:uncharacterized membrane protein